MVEDWVFGMKELEADVVGFGDSSDGVLFPKLYLLKVS